MRALFVGGGTIGSVTPLLAVAEVLRVRDTAVDLRWWGTANGPERAVVAAADILFRAIPSGKLRRYWDVRNVTDLVRIAAGFMVACGAFLRWRPQVVIGAGGYVQVPVCWAAWVFRIPVYVHQQDVHVGFANQLVAWCASAISVTFPETATAFRGRGVVVGNPVRSAILAARDIDPHAARQRFGVAPDRPTVLVLGGGTGARAINDLMWAALRDLLTHVNILHVTGRGKGRGGTSNDECRMTNYRSFEFLTGDLPYAYAAADVVISRAGMGTITELVALGIPVVLIPMPGTHQEANAAAMVARGAAEVWEERTLTPALFADRVRASATHAAARAPRRIVRSAFPTDGVADAMADRIRSFARR